MDVNIVGTGPAGNIDAQVDTTHNALRTSLRPIEHVGQGVIGGHYSLVATYSNTAAKPAAASDVLSMRWTDTRFFFMLLRLAVMKVDTTAYTAAGAQDLSLYIARYFSVSPSGGTQIIPLTGGQRMRSGNMKPCGLDGSSGVLWLSSGDLLTTGTRTLDTQPIGYSAYGNTTTVGGGVVNNDLFNVRDFGEHPPVIGGNEGLVIQTPIGNAQAAGVSKYGFQMDWVEVPVF